MENIARLMKELPACYEKDCFEQGAIKRRRGVANPADLMMLAMFHLQNGCSLIEISEVAKICKLGEMSDVAFMKRFEQCADWFKTISRKIASDGLVNYEKPLWMNNKIVLGLDATNVSEKGRSGRTYRLHYALDLFNMQSYEHTITTSKTGESTTHFNLNKDCLVIGDRAYANIKGIKHCVDSDAQYILRLRKNSFTLRDKAGEKIDLLSVLTKLNENECADIVAFATNLDKASVPIRVCARRKTPEAIACTYKKMRRQESRKQYKISDEAKIFNEFIIVVTNVDMSVTPEEILDAYRFRWQIEIYFKRLKSILDFGELPKRRIGSAIAWLNGKIMIALLIELVIAKTSFSPEENAK